jgi:hypothetical protein
MAKLIEGIRNKGKSFVKGLKWQDYAFFFLIIIYLIFQINLISQFKQLPSPLYGGDYYYSQGSIEHFMSGGNLFSSPNVLGSEPVYLPLYTILAGSIGIIFGVSAFIAMKIFAVIELILALIVMYLFGNYLFKNKSVSLAMVMIYLPLISFPVFKYLQFSLTLMFAAFCFGLFYFFKKRTWQSAIISGILFGLLGISHSVGFVAGVFFLVVIALYILFFEHVTRVSGKWSFDKQHFRESFFKSLKYLVVLGLIGSAIAMLYWFKPIFVYHGKLPVVSSALYTETFSSMGAQLNYIWVTAKSLFFNFSSPFAGLKSILFLVGLISVFLLKTQSASKKFLSLIFVASVLATFHYLVSLNFFGFSFNSTYLSLFSFEMAGVLFSGLALQVASGLIDKYKTYFFIALLVLLLVFNIQQFVEYSKTDQWIRAGRNEMSPYLIEMQSWILKNTDVNDVFLSTNELSFAINGLTGRKELIGRRAHNSLFLDNEPRQAAAAIILYGNDTEERKKLLKEYSVDYFYWDYYWIQSDYSFDDSGKLTSWFDPITMLDNPEYGEIVTKYNLSVFRQHTWPDPAVRYDMKAQLDLIFVLPYQFSMTHPWNPDLDQYLQEVWNYQQGDTDIAKLYKIVNI